jgi:hypothetical protein
LKFCSGKPGNPEKWIKELKYAGNLSTNDLAHGSPINVISEFGYACLSALIAGMVHSKSPNCRALKIPIFLISVPASFIFL